MIETSDSACSGVSWVLRRREAAQMPARGATPLYERKHAKRRHGYPLTQSIRVRRPSLFRLAVPKYPDRRSVFTPAHRRQSCEVSLSPFLLVSTFEDPALSAPVPDVTQYRVTRRSDHGGDLARVRWHGAVQRCRRHRRVATRGCLSRRVVFFLLDPAPARAYTLNHKERKHLA